MLFSSSPKLFNSSLPAVFLLPSCCALVPSFFLLAFWIKFFFNIKIRFFSWTPLLLLLKSASSMTCSNQHDLARKTSRWANSSVFPLNHRPPLFFSLTLLPAGAPTAAKLLHPRWLLTLLITIITPQLDRSWIEVDGQRKKLTNNTSVCKL